MRDYRQLSEDAEQFKKDYDLGYVMVKIGMITDEEAQAIADELGSEVRMTCSLDNYAMKYIANRSVRINFEVAHTLETKIKGLETELAELKREGVTIG